MDNREKLVTKGTQYEDKQSKNTTQYVLDTTIRKQIQIIQNQLKISEGGKWNIHQMPCAYSSRMVKNYRICPIRIEIIHVRHRVVQI